MARRYLVDPLPATGETNLLGPVAHHLSRVVRVRVGEQIRLFDGRGGELTAAVVAVANRSLSLRCGSVEKVVRGLDRQIHLAFSAPKGPRADWLIEHATEVGAAEFWPLETARSTVRGPAAEKRIERWQRIAAAACGQCDRSHLPRIHPVQPLNHWLELQNLPQTRWLASGPEADDLCAPSPAPDSAVLLSGPEGGFTRGELAAIHEAAFTPCSLGPLTLRAETAALAGLVRIAAL